jgi:hypothetical protein
VKIGDELRKARDELTERINDLERRQGDTVERINQQIVKENYER